MQSIRTSQLTRPDFASLHPFYTRCARNDGGNIVTNEILAFLRYDVFSRHLRQRQIQIHTSPATLERHELHFAMQFGGTNFHVVQSAS